MKRKEQPVNLNEPLIYETYIDGQDEPLIVTGINEVLVDLYEADTTRLDALESKLHAKRDKVARSIKTPAVEAPEQPSALFLPTSRKEAKLIEREDAGLKAFDKQYGTSMYEAKQQKRLENTVFLLATQHKLVGDDDSLYYKRKLNKLTKTA